MGARDKLEPVDVVELSDNIGSEKIAGASRRHVPAGDVLRIAPQQIAHGAVVRDLLLAIDGSNLVEGVDARG